MKGWLKLLSKMYYILCNEGMVKMNNKKVCCAKLVLQKHVDGITVLGILNIFTSKA
jgi:hypothetical protein